jgi:putative flippase GtrA
MRAALPQFPAWISQAARFLTVGLLNTALDAAIYYALTRSFAFFGASPVYAKAISYTVGILNSFFWNRLWTFRSRASAGATLLPYAAVNLSGLALNTGTMQLGLKILGLPESVSFILATGLTTGWNFLVSKFLIFRKSA